MILFENGPNDGQRWDLDPRRPLNPIDPWDDRTITENIRMVAPETLVVAYRRLGHPESNRQSLYRLVSEDGQGNFVYRFEKDCTPPVITKAAELRDLEPGAYTVTGEAADELIRQTFQSFERKNKC